MGLSIPGWNWRWEKNIDKVLIKTQSEECDIPLVLRSANNIGVSASETPVLYWEHWF